MTTGAVDSYVSTLGRALHGPADVRRGMLDEVRDGLVDAAEALQHDGLAPGPAAERAVREFGTVEELAPQFQAELVLAQSRRTTALVALAFPLLTSGWDLLWLFSPTPPEHLDAAGMLLVGLMDVVSWGVAVVATLTLASTWLRRIGPRAVAVTGAVVGLAGAAYCLLGGIALALINSGRGPATAALLGGPVAVVLYVVSVLAISAVVRSTTRSLRLALRTPARVGEFTPASRGVRSSESGNSARS